MEWLEYDISEKGVKPHNEKIQVYPEKGNRKTWNI